jgi:23S rRNA pseudouridine1911/1915/1917 synthase
MHKLIIPHELANERLDKALAVLLPDFSRSRLQALIEAGHVTKISSANPQSPVPILDSKYKVHAGDEYQLTIPDAAPTHMLPENIPLDVRYEDDMLLVINKPAGLTVHPGAGTPDGTLVNALLAHCGDSLSGVGGIARPGIVHRIDKDTSGLLMVAKNDTAHHHLSAQLADRSLSRTYTALVWGAPNPPAGSVNAPIDRSPKNRQKMAVVKDGRVAITHYASEKRFVSEEGMVFASLIQCKLETGRTHQIRVHMQHIGHPLVGDAAYGGQRRKLPKSLSDEAKQALEQFPRQVLHASELEFIHPKTGKPMKIKAELPSDLASLVDTLNRSTLA